MGITIGAGWTLGGGFSYTPSITAVAGATASVSVEQDSAITSFNPFSSVQYGATPYTYFVSAGTLPTGISIDSSTGLVSGTPTVVQGAANVTFSVRDVNNQAATTTSIVGFTVTPPPDPYFYDVSLLLNGDGTNGAQNNTFLDSSTNNFAITRNGNTTQGSFSPYGPNWSVLSQRSATDASETRIQVSTTTGLGLASNDFCIEMWVYFTSSYTGDGPFCTSILGTGYITNTWWFGPHSVNSGRVTVYDYNYSSSAPLMAESTSPPINQWTHYALVRNGNSFTIYRNGTSSATATFAGAFAGSSSGLMISKAGDGGGGNSSFGGYISNLRVVNGSSVYTSNFTPPTSPLTAITNTGLLTLQSNRLIDNSTNAASITVSQGTPSIQRFSPFNPTAPYSTSVIGGSGYFDGSGDYLTVAGTSTACALPGDFTIECWYYQTASTLFFGSIFSTTSAYTVLDSLRLSTGASNNTLQVATGLSLIFNANTTFTANTWNHFALVRSGSTLTLYQNGISVGSATNTQSFVSDTFIMGELGGAGGPYYINGYATNYRVVKGTAVYTSSFTPPTAPLTAVTNTQLLTNFINAGIPDLAMQNNLETVGNAQVSTSVVKYGTGSLLFDGTGDYLIAPNNPVYAFSTGDFTIECWYYSGATGQQSVLDTRATSNGPGVLMYTLNNKLRVYSNGGDASGTINIPNSTWTYLVVERISGALYTYVNGVRDINGSAYTPNLTDNSLVVGYDTKYGGFGLNGYLDDIRITNGLGRYSGSSFTPPTTALPTF